MVIKKVNESDKLKYRDLLLLADEQMSMIEKYLYRGEMFALYDDNEVKSICVVTDEQNGIYEIKNLATSPVVKNFFTDHYDHPIYENGRLLTDMIYLKIEFQ